MSAGVWVTGLGLVTPLGPDVASTWRRLVRGDRAIRGVKLFDVASQRVGLAAEVDGVHIDDGPPEVRASWSRTSAMAAAAAGEAMRMAGIDARGRRVGLVVGGTTGGMFETERLLAKLHVDPGCREALVDMLSHPLSATADRLDERHGPFARVGALSSACSSGANAVVMGALWLLEGDVDAVVAGGSDGLCRLTLAGFNALGAIDPLPCRPFHAKRRGTSLGEGAGFLVLERADRARARGAAPVAELAGWALGSEAHHVTQPAPDGAVIASLVERAIARAGLSPADVDYVNAHGTGTPSNDAVEALALGRALGREIGRIPVSSCKGQIGHGLGAAGAIEAAITSLVVARRTLVPTAGLDEPDPSIALVHVPHVGREVGRVRAALSNAFGFGGMDTVLVFVDPRSGARASRGGPSQGARPSAGGVCVTGVAVYGPCGRLGALGVASIPERTFALDAPVDPEPYLDAAAARRFDRASSLGAAVVDHALREARAPREGTGVVLGSAFGNVDGSAAFMHRVFEKGARLASPAEFPNLVPSAPVGNVSIYAGLRGPAFTASSPSLGAESAFAAAWRLVASGEAPRVAAAMAEPKSRIGERVLSALFAGPGGRAGRSPVDLAAAVVLEAPGEAASRGASVLARVEAVVEWRSGGREALAALRPPRGAACEVVLARPSDAADALLEGTGWRSCPRASCAASIGESDGLGAVAVAVAAARVAGGSIGEALVLGLVGGQGAAILLVGA